VSRGSEEDRGKRKTTEGLPSLGREGKQMCTSRWEKESSPPKKERGERIRNLKGDEEPPPTHRRREGPILPQRGAYNRTSGGPRRIPRRERG